MVIMQGLVVVRIAPKMSYKQKDAEKANYMKYLSFISCSLVVPLITGRRLWTDVKRQINPSFDGQITLKTLPKSKFACQFNIWFQ